MKKGIWFLLFFCSYTALSCQQQPLKVLHLTFHKGCMREVEGIAKNLKLDLTTWLIHELPPRFFDEASQGSALYNIGHERAARIWRKHKKFFDQFDVVITSDTVALSRIFLQNGYTKPLIIWISNRFDYCDEGSLDCKFPDQEFYNLIRKAATSSSVTIVASCPYEHHYARRKGVNTGALVIKPCGAYIEDIQKPVVPPSINKSRHFFLPSYHNETKFMNLSKKCVDLKIPHYSGRFAGPKELGDFKGIIHLPYSWSTIALFMNTQMGLPYFVPTPEFVRKLARKGNYWHQDNDMLFAKDLFYLSEWYSKENQDFFVYFDSWEDLQKKITTNDFVAIRKRVKTAAHHHRQTMLARWQKVFKRIEKQLDKKSSS